MKMDNKIELNLYRETWRLYKSKTVVADNLISYINNKIRLASCVLELKSCQLTIESASLIISEYENLV